MAHEIQTLMTDLGITELQAIRMARFRREIERRRPLRATNWLK